MILRPSRSVWLVAASLFILAWPILMASADSGAGDWHVVGEWQTVANGDDVWALARDGDAIWAASASGGVVRWSADGASYRQFLAPQDGLPCNDVRDVVQWRGAWWFATCDGLAVYNAGRNRMEPVTLSLPGPAVTALAVDEANRLWVASGQWWDPALVLNGKTTPGGWTGGGVAYTSDGVNLTVPPSPANGSLPSTNVRDIATWRGAVWVATEPAQEWVPPTRDSEGNPVAGHFQAAGGGLARRDADRWTSFSSAGNEELTDNTRLLVSDAKALYVGTIGRGLLVFDGGRWKALQDCGDDLRCIPDDYVTGLAVGADGAIWVGTARFNGRGTGLAVLDTKGTPTEPSDDAWNQIRVADGLPGSLVHAILPMADGGVWLGTSELDPEGRHHGMGLTKLMNDRETLKTFSTVTTQLGAPIDNDVTALARHPLTGDLWVGTARSGLSVRNPSGRWRSYTRASTGGGLGSDSIADIVIEANGVVWVATRQTTYDRNKNQWIDGGLSRFDGQAWRRLAAPDSGLPSNHLSALALDGRGKLWVGTGATDRGPKENTYRGWGLAVLDTQKQLWERTFTFPVLTSNNITDIAVQGNQVWVATAYFFYVDSRPNGAQFSTGGGVSVYNLDTGKWRKYGAAEGITPAVGGRGSRSSDQLLDVRSLYTDPRGPVWAGGLAYPDATFVPETSPDGVIDILGTDKVTDTHRFPGAGPIVALDRDRAGNLWTASALDGVRIRVQDQWIHQRAKRGGLPADTLTDLSFDGNDIWFGTNGQGLINLVPPPPGPGPTPTPDPNPGSVPDPGVGVIRWLPFKAYLPSARMEVPPRLVPIPGP